MPDHATLLAGARPIRLGVLTTRASDYFADRAPALPEPSRSGSSHAEASFAEMPRLRGVLDAMPVATLLLDESGTVGYRNAAADTLAAAADGVTLGRGAEQRLTAADPAENRALWRAIRVCLAGGETAAVRVSRPSGRPPLRIIVRALPAALRAVDPAASREACVLVQALGVRDISAGQAEAFRRAYGLTAAEARVASLIGSGLSAPEAARILDVSQTTVRSHLSHCFDKVEVRSKAGLARLIGEMPVGVLS